MERLRRVKVKFRSVHYYRTLGGTEACPHAHTYTVEVYCREECEEVLKVLSNIAREVANGLVNDWVGLLYPEPTTENLAISIFSLLPKGKVERVSVREDDTVMAIHDGNSSWVILMGRKRGSTFMAGVRGEVDERGFSVDLRDLESLVEYG